MIPSRYSQSQRDNLFKQRGSRGLDILVQQRNLIPEILHIGLGLDHLIDGLNELLRTAHDVQQAAHRV